MITLLTHFTLLFISILYTVPNIIILIYAYLLNLYKNLFLTTQIALIICRLSITQTQYTIKTVIQILTIFYAIWCLVLILYTYLTIVVKSQEIIWSALITLIILIILIAIIYIKRILYTKWTNSILQIF